MDDLWFRNVILVSEPWSSSPCSKLHKPSSTAAVSEELSYSTSNDSQTLLISDEDSSTVTNQAEYDEQEIDEKETTTCTQPDERPTRLNAMASKARYLSSSPSNLKRSRNLRRSSAAGTTGRRLHKTMSCKSLCELELEEVQGFMDLGFIFNKENMSKRMMSVIPGLQRLESSGSIQEKDNILMGSSPHTETEGVEEAEAEQPMVRPYLSEAWLIRRPDSPLLNLRIPRDCTAADMKKHLRYWARAVASAIELET